MTTEIKDLYEDGESSCCGARVITPDICADCKEHCSVVKEDEDDDNRGLPFSPVIA